MEFILFVTELFVVTSLLTICSESSDDWSYLKPEDASTWKYHWKYCNGTKQSPINIVPKETTFDAGLKDLTIDFEPVVSAELVNNGHTVQATFKTGKSNISGGYLLSQFRAVQMHFHWGSDDSQGSEHQISGKKYPMEVHIVHYNAEKYPNNVSNAMVQPDGLAVLGFLVEIAENDNPAIKPIVDKLNATLCKGEKAFIPALEPIKFIPQPDFQQYYTYKGSLTTPGCFESVQWFVFNHTFKISSSQLAQFRKLFDEKRQKTKIHHLEDNFRPVQPLNGRNVTRSFKRPPFPCGKISNTTMACSALADDKVVFYEAVVNMCSLPATVTLQVSQPDIRYQSAESFYSDIKPPKKIGSLDYGFTMEMHSHFSETNPSTLHVSISQVHLFSKDKRKEVMSVNFDDGGCQLGRCIKHSCNKHWCDGRAFGYDKHDTLYVGFSSTFRDLTAANPVVDVNFYHNVSEKWYLTASETFTNNEEKTVHLTGLLVHDNLSAKHRREAVKQSQWENVKFKAKIIKTEENVLYQLLMSPSDGLYYRVLKDEFTLACVKHTSKPARLGSSGKIAIGVSVVSMVVILAGITMGLLYCRRKQFTRHQPTLIDDMDDYKL